jgi:ring-1,2-phenylacetyl-CoA epoxidase subunit PaaD
VTAPGELVAAVEDPELPFVTIGDLGIVRSVDVDWADVTVVLTPTFTGCPAMDQITTDVAAALRAGGYRPTVRRALSPAWSTDWITAEGRRKLAAAGIAPPPDDVAGRGLTVALDGPVACPRCGSRRSRRQSAFGAWACTAPYVCNACKEPFEWFKPL